MVPQNKTVLVIEDDDMLRQLIINQLTVKFPAIPARDGQEGIEQTLSQKPGIVVLDMLMPRLDGFGYLEQLRASADPEIAKTAVMVVSNLSDPESIARAKGLGILEYYIKSDIQSGVLLNRINRYFTQGT